jgi:pimeloyl-ACP methyl ester carboxylesterase
MTKKFFISHRWILILAVAIATKTSAAAEIFFHFSDPSLTDNRSLALEAHEYRPKQWNGKVILMSHGSTGGNASAIKTSIKFAAIGKIATENGYVFITFMRKGRGQSEGNFTEESGRCDYGSLSRELSEAEMQLKQVLQQVKSRHEVSTVILMGHSRGGFLSSAYAAKNPDEVQAVVNLAGAWSAVCEGKNGGLGRQRLEESAKKFKTQFWGYFENDSYFATDKFGDPDYSWFKKISDQQQVTFRVFSDAGRKDGHQAPTWAPKEWSDVFFQMLNVVIGRNSGNDAKNKKASLLTQ